MIFLDTEFTCLGAPELLSYAMVSLDGAEIYGELDLVGDPIGLARSRAASGFVRKVVIPQFGRMPDSKCSATELGGCAGHWLIERAAHAGERVTIAFDFDGDFVLMRKAMLEAGIWERVQPVLLIENIDCITSSTASAAAAEASWVESALYRGLDRHHALADALALRAAWRAAHNR